MQSIKDTMSMNNVVNKVNNNDNVRTRRSIVEVDHIADKLVAQLDNPIARSFYCKVAYALTEAQIQHNLETAMKGNSPQKYFTWLCKKDML